MWGGRGCGQPAAIGGVCSSTIVQLVAPLVNDVQAGHPAPLLRVSFFPLALRLFELEDLFVVFILQVRILSLRQGCCRRSKNSTAWPLAQRPERRRLRGLVPLTLHLPARSRPTLTLTLTLSLTDSASAPAFTAAAFARLFPAPTARFRAV